MLRNVLPGTSQNRLESAICYVLLTIGVLLRVLSPPGKDFWEDEIIAATHAVQPFWQVLVSVIRHDIHPPLYFLQLHVWGLLGRSDVWLTLNSVAWSLAALFSLWWVVRRQNGPRVALLAVTVFSALPSPVYMAQQLRMYAMLATLVIWAFYFAWRIFGEGDRRRLTVALHFLFLLAIINIHAIGFVAVLLNGLYALYLCVSAQMSRRSLFFWTGLYGLSALFALPWLVKSMLHDANLGEPAWVEGVFYSMSSTILGNAGNPGPAALAAGIALFMLVLGQGIANRSARPLSIFFLITPILLAAAVAPFTTLFKWNFFSTIAAPFFAITLAFVLAEERWFRFLAAGSVAALLGFGIFSSLFTRQTSNYRHYADVIRANYRAGDVVYVPQLSHFEGMAWYLVGPDWGSPLQTSAPPSAQWQAVYNWLGPELVSVLKLMPEGQMLNRGGVTLVVGNGSADQIRDAARIWFVAQPRADLLPGYPPADFWGLRPSWSQAGYTSLILYGPAAR